MHLNELIIEKYYKYCVRWKIINYMTNMEEKQVFMLKKYLIKNKNQIKIRKEKIASIRIIIIFLLFYFFYFLFFPRIGHPERPILIRHYTPINYLSSIYLKTNGIIHSTSSNKLIPLVWMLFFNALWSFIHLLEYSEKH